MPARIVENDFGMALALISCSCASALNLTTFYHQDHLRSGWPDDGNAILHGESRGSDARRKPIQQQLCTSAVLLITMLQRVKVTLLTHDCQPVRKDDEGFRHINMIWPCKFFSSQQHPPSTMRAGGAATFALAVGFA